MTTTDPTYTVVAHLRSGTDLKGTAGAHSADDLEAVRLEVMEILESKGVLIIGTPGGGSVIPASSVDYVEFVLEATPR